MDEWFDARYMRSVRIPPGKVLYHGTSTVPPSLVARQWVGPSGFYVTPLRDVAEDFARHAEARFMDRIGSGRVLEFTAEDLGLDEVLVVSREPDGHLVEQACRSGYSGVWGPRLWGIFVCGVDPADVLRSHESQPR